MAEPCGSDELNKSKVMLSLDLASLIAVVVTMPVLIFCGGTP